jgi:hypothetical protein
VWHVLRGDALRDVGSLPMGPYRTYLLAGFFRGRPGGTGTLGDWGWASTAVG